ncbi:MAG: radical SAM protein, partial [Dehalococcoidia bacterium]|nr:radical SAM protein [Dehalococcoidia bacterium]
ELTLDEIREIVSNRLFKSVEKVSLSGGEPTLRDDLIDIAQTAVERLPRIKEIIYLTNGLEPDLIIPKAKELLMLVRSSGSIKLSMSVSIDGCGETHEQIRRVPDAFERVGETLRRLKDLQRTTPFYLGCVCVVQPLNVGNLVQVSDFCQGLDLPLTLVPVWPGRLFVDSVAASDALRMTGAQLDSLENVLQHEIQERLLPANIPFWREYFKITGGEKRKLPCFLLHHYARLDADGTLGACYVDSSTEYGSALDKPADVLWYSDYAKEKRKKIRAQFCPDCTIYCDLAFAFSHEFFYYAKFLLKEKSRKLLGK